MAAASFLGSPHRRFNPLTGRWILVSPQRTARPWQGRVEQLPDLSRPRYDPSCYLCPGNARAGGARNPAYEGTFVFDNDYPALEARAGKTTLDDGGILVAESETGCCRVVCFSSRHDLSLPEMAAGDVRRVVDVWAAQTRELGERRELGYVQVFENRGEMMGASNPHPHGQIWATGDLPVEPALEQASLEEHGRNHGGCLLCGTLTLELGLGERLVLGNEHFSALVPFWAVWPFETLVLGRRHSPALPDLGSEERDALADVLRRLTRCYDALFGVPFPYSMGFHQQPTDGAAHGEWHLHAHFYPPLLRSATVRKFMVGFEMLGTPQRDLTAEQAAERLRAAAARER